MEGNGTETKYMLNSAICVQKRPSPLKGIAVTKHDAAPKQCCGAIYFCEESDVGLLCLVFSDNLLSVKSVLLNKGMQNTCTVYAK